MRSDSTPDSIATGTTDHDDPGALARRDPPPSFGQRHGLKVMGVIMAVMFTTVIIAQVAC